MTLEQRIKKLENKIGKLLEPTTMNASVDVKKPGDMMTVEELHELVDKISGENKNPTTIPEYVQIILSFINKQSLFNVENYNLTGDGFETRLIITATGRAGKAK